LVLKTFLSVYTVWVAFYILTLRRVLLACSRENRGLPPPFLWLQIVPVVSFAWQFVNVIALGRSVEAETKARGPVVRRPAESLGITTFILQILAFVLALVANSGDGPFGPPEAHSLALASEPSRIWTYLMWASIAVFASHLLAWARYWYVTTVYEKALDRRNSDWALQPGRKAS
jgi:hypothetical protein